MVVQPREPCDPASHEIELTVEGEGLTDTVLAGDPTQFTIEAREVETGLMCTNSAALVGVQLLLPQAIERPADVNAELSEVIGITTDEAGVLTVTYSVLAWTRYSIIISVGTGTSMRTEESIDVHNLPRPPPQVTRLHTAALHVKNPFCKCELTPM